jgi:hypothetical protein
MPDLTGRKNGRAALLARLRGRRKFSKHPDNPHQETQQQDLFHVRSGPSHYHAIERDRGGTGSAAWQKQGKIGINFRGGERPGRNRYLTRVTRILYKQT